VLNHPDCRPGFGAEARLRGWRKWRQSAAYVSATAVNRVD